MFPRRPKILRRSSGWWRDADVVVLLALLVVASSVWCFIAIADAVVEGKTHHIDEALILALRNPADPSDPIGPEWFEEVMRDLTALGGYAVLGLLTSIVVGFLILDRKFHAVWLILIATLGGVLLSNLLKAVFGRPRPDLVPHLAYSSSWSFPSGHSMLSAVVYLTLGSLLDRLIRPRRLRLYVLAVALLLSFLVGVSRVYVGVHYPTDVLAGWVVGLAWAVICWLLAQWLQRHGMVEDSTG